MKDNYKSYQHEDLLLEMDDLADDLGTQNNPHLIPVEVDLIQARVARLQVTDLCNDIYTVLCQYRVFRNHHISRQRRLDLSALEELVRDSSQYPNKEACISVLDQRVSRIKTRWYNLRRKSALRNRINYILDIYSLPQIDKAGQDLASEMRSHEILVKQFHLTIGEDVEKLRDELATAKQTIIILEQRIKALQDQSEPGRGNNHSNNANNNTGGYTGLFGKVFK